MKNPDIDHSLKAGSSGNNEDYLWLGPEKNVKAALILDGTSGTEADFGSIEEETGGQRYVRLFAEEVEKILQENPSKDLEEVMKSAISRIWDRFEKEAKKNVEQYFNGGESTLQRTETAPAAVGSIIRWDDKELELMHVGDVETYIVKKENTDTYSNTIHQRFDELRDKYVERYGRDSEEVKDITNRHRSAHNLPGTYPNMSFNPLAVEKLGVKKTYDIANIERVVLSTDGGTTRMKRILEMSEKEVLEFLEEKGVKDAIESLRKEEKRGKINALKDSDDAAIADIRFEK